MIGLCLSIILLNILFIISLVKFTISTTWWAIITIRVILMIIWASLQSTTTKESMINALHGSVFFPPKIDGGNHNK